MSTTTRIRAQRASSPGRRDDPASAAHARIRPRWFIYDRARPTKLLAVLPAGRFGGPDAARAFYRRGALVTVTDVLVVPEGRP